MTLTSYERESTWKTTVTWTSGSVAVDPLNNMSYIDIYKSDGTYLIQSASGERSDTGVYHYYISTASTDPLGIYRIRWYGDFNFGGHFGYLPLSQQEAVVIENIVQS